MLVVDGGCSKTLSSCCAVDTGWEGGKLGLEAACIANWNSSSRSSLEGNCCCCRDYGRRPWRARGFCGCEGLSLLQGTQWSMDSGSDEVSDIVAGSVRSRACMGMGWRSMQRC